MANPILPDLSKTEQILLYTKLNEYNRGRASFKETGSYLVVLPREGHPSYSLWLFSPVLERQSILYIHDLSPNINEALRIASTLLYYSPRMLLLMEYNEKRMQSNGDDIISFGKYRGHFLHEILKIDPGYLGWVGYKFTPRIPKQERFVKIAQAYHSVHLDLLQRKVKQANQVSRYLGEVGEKVADLALRVLRVKLEDDPYKTRFKGETPLFYVRQVLTLTDASGNLVTMSRAAKNPGMESCSLSALEHTYRPDEMIYVASAHIARTYEIRGFRYTRLSHVKLSPINTVA